MTMLSSMVDIHCSTNIKTTGEVKNISSSCYNVIRNLGYWHSYGCYLTCTNHPHTVTDQIHPLMATSTRGNKSNQWRPHSGSDLALTHPGMDTGPLWVSCGVWHQGTGGRSFEYCGFEGGASTDQTCSHRCS